MFCLDFHINFGKFEQWTKQNNLLKVSKAAKNRYNQVPFQDDSARHTANRLFQ